MPSARTLDAITVDAAGTAVELVAPFERLQASLGEHGAVRTPEEIRAAFAAEIAHYVPRSHEGRDRASLAHLRRDSVGVFLAHLGVELDPDHFVDAFVEAIEFRPVEGVTQALRRLRSAGLELACVANWDTSLESHLRQAGLAGFFTTIVSSAEAGAPKPSPVPFLLALERLGVDSRRALHIGDGEVDADGARAAGLAFEPVPLATLPDRLGL